MLKSLEECSLTNSQIASARQLRTKNDVKMLKFDQEQVMMYQKLSTVKPTISTQPSRDLYQSESIRKLNFSKQKLDQQKEIDRENQRMFSKILAMYEVRDRPRELRSESRSKSPN